MTDNDIIKAWEWHISPVHSNGMKIYSTVVECSRELAENTLDLINRYKAEIERKTNLISETVDEYAKFKEAAKRRETARVRNIEQVADEEINRLNAEIERLQSIVNAELDTIHDLGDDYERALKEGQELVKTAKSEAIKEFAVRLKENMQWGDIVTNATHAIIDNLVKEMTENDFKES